MNPRIAAVTAHDDHTLLLTFTNGEVRRFDMTPYLGYPAFEPLRQISFFKLARAGHGTVTWPSDIDFDPDTLYMESFPVEQKSVSEEFPELFHYTTVDAFRSIYKSRKFWATHYKDLTDSSELSQFKKKLSEFILPTIRELCEEKMRSGALSAEEVNNSGGIDAVVKQAIATQLEKLHWHAFGDPGFPDTFVCSFCAHEHRSYEAKHGLLSQWRGYGAGDGVAIVLDTRFMERRMQQEQEKFGYPIHHIGDVKYDNDVDAAKIRNDFHEAFDQLPEWIRAIESNKAPNLPDPIKFFDHVISGSTLVKHQGFHEEKEVRIVVSLWPTNPDSKFKPDRPCESKAIKYRPKGEREIRYIELFGDKDLPITRVIVGPSRFQNSNFQTISELVKYDPRDIEVLKSETPFLG